MTETLYIAIYRVSPTSRWQSFSGGEFTEHRLAKNFIECKRATGWTCELAIVNGPVVPVQTPTEVEAILGAF